MTYEMLMKSLNSIHPGSFVRICYTTEVPLKAAYAKQGFKIYRTCHSTVRVGINYSNIRFVINERAQRPQSSGARKNNIVPVVKNKIYKNQETGQMYLRIYPTSKGTNKVSEYMVYDPQWGLTSIQPSDEAMQMVRESYFTGRYSPVAMIKIENVDRLGKYGRIDE